MQTKSVSQPSATQSFLNTCDRIAYSKYVSVAINVGILVSICFGLLSSLGAFHFLGHAAAYKLTYSMYIVGTACILTSLVLRIYKECRQIKL